MPEHEPIELGNRRELLVDDFLIDRLTNAQLRLHSPTPREVVLRTDRPWEGNMNTFNTLMKVDDVWRLYYRGWQVNLSAEGKAKGDGLNTAHEPTICLATSGDGRHWERPELGLFEFAGSRANNIVFQGQGWHGFSPFLDSNPAAAGDARFKAIGVPDGLPHRLHVYASPDGLRWRLLFAEPILAGVGDFDSHNTVQFDPLIGAYRLYFRKNLQVDGRFFRFIMTATSPDLKQWSEAVLLEYPGALQEQLYTNNILRYPRAPHLQIGLPARYVERLPWTPSMEQLPELEHRRRRHAVNARYGTALSDAVFMTSRDGKTFRRWGEAFIRPGLRAAGSWTYGDIYPAWGLVQTESDLPGGGPELSICASEGYWRGAGSDIRRYSLRVDGFVSLQAPRAGGEMISKPLTFTGSRLSFNISTSAAGSARVGLADPQGNFLPGFALDDCWEIIGDSLDYTVTWRCGSDLSALAGRPLRLHLRLFDADLYSLQFH